MKCLWRASRTSSGTAVANVQYFWLRSGIILTLQYVTNQEMGPFKRMFSNLKEAVAYFGLPALLPWNPSSGKG